MTQRLKHVFGRELDLLLGAGRRLRSILRRPAGGRGKRSAGAPGERVAAPRPPRRAPRRRLAPGWTNAGSLAVSIALHIVVFGILVSRLFPVVETEGERGEFVVEVRLRLPPPPAPAPQPEPEEAAPETDPEPAEVPAESAEADAETRTETVTETAGEPAVASSPSFGDAGETSEGTRREPTLEIRARSVGLGGPPPLGVRDGANGLASRFAGKQEALRRYGGSSATESAVERGLRWLSEHQDPGGRWDCDGYTRHCDRYSPCKGGGFREFDVGVTSLALLAFLGAGHRPDLDGPYRQNVGKGLEFLLREQETSGVVGRDGDHWFYNHALATFALSEAWAVSRSREYREAVDRALRFSAMAQQSTGGWDYTSDATGRSDLSITGWQIMAMRSAENSGIPLPPGMKERARGFLRTAFTASGWGIYANKGTEAGRRGINMAAVALLSHLYVDGAPTAAACRLASERILRRHPPDWKSTGRWDHSYQSFYYWYTATLCLFHLGGPQWEAWNHLLKRELLPLESRSPHAEGSWSPERSWIGMSGGRVYATAINVLTLEVYYRYRPLYATRSR